MKIQELILNKLEYKIELSRNRMLYDGQAKGLSHPRTIKHSQKLDVQLNQYHRIRSH